MTVNVYSRYPWGYSEVTTYTVNVEAVAGNFYQVDGELPLKHRLGIGIVVANVYTPEGTIIDGGYKSQLKLFFSPSADTNYARVDFSGSKIKIKYKYVEEYLRNGETTGENEGEQVTYVTYDEQSFPGPYDYTVIDGYQDPTGLYYNVHHYNKDIIIDIYVDLFYYTLSIKPNGGTGGSLPSSQQVQPGFTIDHNYEVPVRAGYEFLGWDENQAAAEPTYDARKAGFKQAASALIAQGGINGFMMPGRNVALFAIWRPWTFLPVTLNGKIVHSFSIKTIYRDGDG